MASCFGPAYEFAFILDTDLRKRKLRNKVPITFVTSEPYIGHLGLGGVGDSKSHARVASCAATTSSGSPTPRPPRSRPASCSRPSSTTWASVLKEHEVPFKMAMMLPAFKGVDAVAAVPKLCNPRGFVLIDEYQRSKAYKNIFSAGVCVAIPPVEVTPGAHRRAQDRLHDRDHGHAPSCTTSPTSWPASTAEHQGHLERDLPGRHGRHRRRLRGAAADPAAQRELVQEGQVGAPGQDRASRSTSCAR